MVKRLSILFCALFLTLLWGQSKFQKYQLRFSNKDAVKIITIETPSRSRAIYITAITVNGEAQWIMNTRKSHITKANTVFWNDEVNTNKTVLIFNDLAGKEEISITFYGQETVFETATLSIYGGRGERSLVMIHNYDLRRIQ